MLTSAIQENARRVEENFMSLDLEKFTVALEEFYEEVKKDELLGPIFIKHVSNWDSHLKKIGIFWESHLQSPGLYKGNPLLVHQKLHEKDPMNEIMFKRWLELFEVKMKEHLGIAAKPVIVKARIIGGTLFGRILNEELEVPGFPPFGAI